MSRTLHLFEGFGVELEYMIVDQNTLDVKPMVDRLFREAYESNDSTIDCGTISLSNELTNHVLELKTTAPVMTLSGVEKIFQAEIQTLNHKLSRYQARLMPTAMHPWMDSTREMYLWPHGDRTIYETYHRIFNCKGHGWANVQSVHLNLPFCGDDEFARLHTAIRLILPILPALSASSPIVDSSKSAWTSARLLAYIENQKKMPQITGFVIPERVFSRQEYEDRILRPIYLALAKEDKEGVLQEEWVNSRGAIARFDRSTIEIRILDIQENPKMDLTILRLIIALIKALTTEEWINYDAQSRFEEGFLQTILFDVAKSGFSAVIKDEDYLKALDYRQQSPVTLRDLWVHLLEKISGFLDYDDIDLMRLLIRSGNLSERILMAADSDYSKEKLNPIYCSLTAALDSGKMFLPKLALMR